MSKNEISELLQTLDIECNCYKETCDKCLAKYEIDRIIKCHNSVKEYLKIYKQYSVDFLALYNLYFKE
jgi:hypothetical protein